MVLGYMPNGDDSAQTLFGAGTHPSCTRSEVRICEHQELEGATTAQQVHSGVQAPVRDVSIRRDENSDVGRRRNLKQPLGLLRAECRRERAAQHQAVQPLSP